MTTYTGVYEFNDRGKGIALAKVRDEIRGYSFGRVPGGIIWQCEDGSFLKTVAYRDGDPHKSAQRSPLMELAIPWSRQPSAFEPESSRIKNRLSDAYVAAFGQKLAVHLHTTGYILSGDPSHFRFELLAVDLQTGGERKLIVIQSPLNIKMCLDPVQVTLALCTHDRLMVDLQPRADRFKGIRRVGPATV